jgi:hypothetical protein
MRPGVNRVTFPSIAFQYLWDIILNLFIVASTFALLMLSVVFSGS